MRMSTARFVLAAVLLGACSTGTSEEARNVAVPGATTLSQLLPVGTQFPVGNTGAVMVAASATQFCSIDHVGALWCWGQKPSGLAPGSEIARTTAPVRVTIAGVQQVSAVSAGSSDTTCAVGNAAVFCWGSNQWRQALPSSSALYIAVPTRVFGLPDGIVDVVSGAATSCALTNTGRVFCWGNRRLGVLGLDAFNSQTDIFGPVEVRGAPALSKLAGGDDTYCGITAAGGLWCWGRNYIALVGDGLTQMVYAPKSIMAEGQVRDVSFARGTACAAMVNGQLKCWGASSSFIFSAGQQSQYQGSPVAISNWTGNAMQVAVGDSRVCVLDGNLDVWCWGMYPWSNGTWDAPQRAPGMVDIMSIDLNDQGTLCAVTWDAELKCLGNDFEGAAGNGDAVTGRVETATRVGTFGVLTAAPPTTVPPATTAAPSTTFPPTTSTVPSTTVSPSTTRPAPTTTVQPGATTVIPVTTTAASGSTTPVSSPPQVTSSPQPVEPSSSAVSTPDLADTGVVQTLVTLPVVSSVSELRQVLIVKKGRFVTGASVARFATLGAPKGSRITLSVASAGRKVCARSGTGIFGAKAGVCRVTVKVTPKGKKPRVRTVSVQVTG